MAAAIRGVCRAAIFTLDEHFLDHRRRSEDIQPSQQQPSIGGEALQDRVRERPPIILGIGRTRILVRLEQRDEIAKQCAGAMDLQPFVVFERSRDVVGDDEVRLEEPCQWALGRR